MAPLLHVVGLMLFPLLACCFYCSQWHAKSPSLLAWPLCPHALWAPGVVYCFLHSLPMTGTMLLLAIPTVWWAGYSSLPVQYTNPTEWSCSLVCWWWPPLTTPQLQVQELNSFHSTSSRWLHNTEKTELDFRTETQSQALALTPFIPLNWLMLKSLNKTI